MDYEAQVEWFRKHPGIHYDICYGDGSITIWKVSKKGTVIRTESFSLTRGELLKSQTERTPLLEKYFTKFMEKNAKVRVAKEEEADGDHI